MICISLKKHFVNPFDSWFFLKPPVNWWVDNFLSTIGLWYLQLYGISCKLSTCLHCSVGVHSEQPPPEAMMQLHRIADVEIGWLAIVYSMIRKITTVDPLGPAVITLILDECPLPSKVIVITHHWLSCLYGDTLKDLLPHLITWFLVLISVNTILLIFCVMQFGF